MKIYRISTIRRPGREHDGYEYFTNKKLAKKKQDENELKYALNCKDDDEDDFYLEDKEQSYDKDEVETLDLHLSKAAVIAFLNTHCSYSDNG